MSRRAPTSSRRARLALLLGPLAVAVALGGAATGCSSWDPAELDQKQELRALGAACGAVRPRAVLLVPLDEVRLPAPDPEQAKGPMRCEVRRLHGELEAALARVVERAEVASVGSAAAARQALERGCDLLLELRVERWNAAFLGTTGWWYPNALFVGWYFWPVGAWLIADERYGLDCRVSFTLRDAHSEVLVGGDVLEVVSDAAEPAREPTPEEVVHPPRLVLSDGDRGLDFFSTWMPGSLDPDQWAEVARILEPYALRHVAVRVAAAVARELDRDARRGPEARRRRYATTHAVVAGVSEYPDAPCPGAQQDAEACARLLRGEERRLRPPGAGEHSAAPLPRWLPEKNLTLRVNAQASRQTLLDAVAAAARAAREEDTLVLYFAGRGRRGAGPGLAGLSLVDAAGAELSLGALAEALAGARARARLIALDLDFAPGPRGLAPDPAAPPLPADAELQRELRGLLHPEGRGAVILASRLAPGEQAQAYAFSAGQEEGLLTHYLLRGLRGEADAGEDGLTYAELASYLAGHVENLSAVALPRRQVPLIVLLGKDQHVGREPE
ncbi:MAG: hypothetical protein AB7N76_05000 [Planctomycetota bacterium]